MSLLYFVFELLMAESLMHVFMRAAPKSRPSVSVTKMTLQDRLDGLVYKKNLERLIERHRQFEDAKE